MPIIPGGARYGLGLWNSIAGTMAVEILMFAAGVWMYARATRAKDRIGRWAFIAYVLVLLAIYAGNSFGSPPGSVTEVAWGALALPFVFIPWAWLFDRHRTARS
jgi:heme A synthase